MSALPPSNDRPAESTRQRVSSGAVRLFHEYANWLVSISWKRFFLLSLLLLIASAILQNLPPFSYRLATGGPSVIVTPPSPPSPPSLPSPPSPSESRSRQPAVRIEKKDDNGREVVISIDREGVRITPRAS